MNRGRVGLGEKKQALHGLRRKARAYRMMKVGDICGRSSPAGTSNFSQKLQGPPLRKDRRGSDEVSGEGRWATVIRERGEPVEGPGSSSTITQEALRVVTYPTAQLRIIKLISLKTL